MTAIVFANLVDASPFLKLYQRGRFEGLEEGDTGQDSDLTVIITGSGKIKSTLQTERLLRSEKFERLIHPGSGTSLSADFSPGTLLGISQVYEGDRVELSSPTYPRMPLEVPFTGLKTATLVTQDHTFSENAEQSYWQRIADLSDNTSYAVAYVAATQGVPCHVLKVVTASLEDKTNGNEPVEGYLNKLAQYLVTAL